MVYAAIIIAIIAAVAIAANMPKQPSSKPAALGDFDFPQFEVGTPECVIFGDCWVPDWMVLGYGNYRSQPIYPSGGKGGGGDSAANGAMISES